jgi:hypothetical protein
MHVLAHQGALGDWILTFPILRGLGTLGPTLAVAPAGKARLAAAMIAGVQAAGIESQPWAGLFDSGDSGDSRGSRASGGSGGGAAGGADPRFGPGDLLISFVAGPGDPWTRNLRVLAPDSRQFFVDPRPPQDWGGHITGWYAAELERQGLVLPRVPIPLRQRADGPIVIHPGSGGEHKRWPLVRFLEVAGTLRRRGRIVHLVISEVELDRWPAAEVRHLVDDYGGSILTDLSVFYAELAGAAMFVGNDSGPTHLAAQIGLPTLALFGPTDPRRWRPLGPAVTVLAPPSLSPMTWLEPNAVIAAVAVTL